MPNLTKRVVDAAKVNGSGWRWLGDDEVPGFGVRIYGSGRKLFALRYRTRSGRQRMVQLGQFGELTVQQARDVARREKVRVLEGGDPLADRKRQEAGIRTISDLTDRWIDDYAKAHRKRWVEDERRVNGRIRPPLGQVHLEDLTVDRLAAWHQKIGKDSPVEANRCLETLRAAWRWGDRQGLLLSGLEDPTGKVKKFKERSRDRWLRKDELERLMSEVRKYEDPYVRAAIPLLLLTGLRKGELLSARWTDVDLERAEITLPETKSGEAQVRLLPYPAVAILRDLPRERSPWVFPSPVNPSEHRRDLKRPWETIRQAAQLPDVTLHDLRRTAGSFMAQAGVPLQMIQQVLGHSHPSVTKLYARLASKNERAALETLAGELRGVLDSGPSLAQPSSPEFRSRREPIAKESESSGDLARRQRALAEELESESAQ